MRKMFIFLMLSCSILLFCNKKRRRVEPTFQIALVKESYIDKSENEFSKGQREETSYIGIFPKENDTITIFRLNEDLKENPEKTLFWIKTNKEKESAIIYSSNTDKCINMIFKPNNKIIVDQDIYTLNNEYYKYLKKEILINNSILDFAYFLKDGYGDYSQLLELLNKNWGNQKRSNKNRIITAKISNKNQQTENKIFTYTLNYIYDQKGNLKIIKGNNNFNKKYINETKKHIHYSINKLINERAQLNEDLYIDKNRLFDSIVGNYEQYSTAKTFYYVKYQSSLKIVKTLKKPKDLQEIFILFK